MKRRVGREYEGGSERKMKEKNLRKFYIPMCTVSFMSLG